MTISAEGSLRALPFPALVVSLAPVPQQPPLPRAPTEISVSRCRSCPHLGAHLDEPCPYGSRTVLSE